jgi:hypothetical protein
VRNDGQLDMRSWAGGTTSSHFRGPSLGTTPSQPMTPSALITAAATKARANCPVGVDDDTGDPG